MSLLSSLFAYGRKMTALRWVRFCVVGGAATLCYLLLGLLFVTLLRLPVLVGNGLAYVLSFVVSYLGQSRWTFAASTQATSSRTRLPAFALTQLFGLGLNSVLIGLFTGLGLAYELAMPVTAMLVAVVVYALCRFGVFRQSGGGGEPTRHTDAADRVASAACSDHDEEKQKV